MNASDICRLTYEMASTIREAGYDVDEDELNDLLVKELGEPKYLPDAVLHATLEAFASSSASTIF